MIWFELCEVHREISISFWRCVKFGIVWILESRCFNWFIKLEIYHVWTLTFHCFNRWKPAHALICVLWIPLKILIFSATLCIFVYSFDFSTQMDWKHVGYALKHLFLAASCSLWIGKYITYFFLAVPYGFYLHPGNYERIWKFAKKKKESTYLNNLPIRYKCRHNSSILAFW